MNLKRKNPNGILPNQQYIRDHEYLNPLYLMIERFPKKFKHINKDTFRIRGNNINKYNNLSNRYPDLIKEWDYEKNELDPNKISPFTHNSAWWVCAAGHSFYQQIKSRVYEHGCPYCSGRKPCSDNCLATKYPELSEEWDYEKNYPLTPENVVFGSGKKVWWICKICKLEWYATIHSRTTHKSGCNQCNKPDQTKNKSASEWIEIAKELKEKHGSIPNYNYLIQNGYNGLYKVMKRYPEKFKGV